MNKLILGLIVFVPVVLVTGCATERVYYTPTYNTPNTRYVYSAGYHTSPYWNFDYYNNGDAYYYGYDDLGDVGYWGMYNSYQVY
jgi:hypothetical protein